MEWKEVPTEKKWVLQDNGDVAAAIYLIDKEGIKNCYQTKTIISAIYLGRKKFNNLEKRKRDWSASTKKFATSEARQNYIQTKKREIMKYIKIRIS